MLTAMGDVMREAYKRNWITTRDGNISLKRKNSNLLYITPSGVRKTIIHPEQIIKIPIKEGILDLAEGINPSGELHMHWNIQKILQEQGPLYIFIQPFVSPLCMLVYVFTRLSNHSQNFIDIQELERMCPRTLH